MNKKFFYWQCSNLNNEYTVEKVKAIYTVEELLKCFAETKFPFNMFAAFKEGCQPIQEEIINLIKVTYAWKSGETKDYETFLKTCWESKIFDRHEVNGIYCSFKKISIWLNEDCEEVEEVFEKLGYQNIRCTNIRHKSDMSTLDRRWTIGYFDSKIGINFSKLAGHRKQYHSMRSEEKLLQYITKIHHLYNNPKGMGIWISSNILRETEWRKANPNNRFVNASLKIPLKNANEILLKLFLSLPLSIFPKATNIYLAFCFYQNEILEIGIYLTGNYKVFKDENGQRTVDDIALIVAHKLKQIILEYFDPLEDETILINITNTVPAEDTCFTDSSCEFEVLNPRRRLINI